MSFVLLGRNLNPAEDESAVRTYHCTSLASRLLSLKAEGYLVITSKRVVFFGQGTSYAGQSVLHSEVPIQDISGINTYKGTYFGIMHFLTALIVGFVVGNLVGAVLTAILGLVLALFDASITATQGILAILALIVLLFSSSYPRDNIRRPVLAATGAALLAGPGGLTLAIGAVSSLLGSDDGLGTVLLLLAFFAAIYALVTAFWYARRETMSLAIGSRGGSNTPIAISGISVFGLFNTAALRALTAEPAEDAEAMIKELGAVITDIQQLGVEGIEKWATV